MMSYKTSFKSRTRAIPGRNSSTKIISQQTATPTRSTLRHKVAPNIVLEVIRRSPPQLDPRLPPLLFIHGSYHAAWCYDEKFLPFFAEAGFDSYAVSLRAQGGSDRIAGAKAAGTMATHASDLHALITTLIAKDPSSPPPVLIGHSFGGLALQKLLVDFPRLPLDAVVLLNSVPPSGNKDMIGRFLRRDFLLSLRITAAFVLRTFARNAKSCREAFFSDALPEADLLRYQGQLAMASPVSLVDLQALSREVPLPPLDKNHPRALVIGGEADRVVDVEAVEELAAYFGTSPTLLAGLPHDSMLDVQWRDVANLILNFIATKPRLE